jgi:antitoxin HigA-1
MSVIEPIHAGQLVRSQRLEPHGLTVADGARVLGITRQALNNLINGHAGVYPEMALRLAKAFNTDAEEWLHHQLVYDLAQACKRAGQLNLIWMAQRPLERQARLL